MTNQQLDIFKDKSGRLLCVKDSGDVEKQGTPGILKAFALADDAERLAGKTSQQQVVVSGTASAGMAVMSPCGRSSKFA